MIPNIYDPKVLVRKYRLYPNNEQIAVLNQDFWNARFVYNHLIKTFQFLRKKNKTWRSYKDWSRITKKLKEKTNTSFLSSTYSQVLQSVAQNLNSAFQNMFAGLGKYPKFKKRKGHQSIRFNQLAIPELQASVISFPWKLWHVKTVFHRAMPNKDKYDSTSVTVSKDSSWRYFAAITFVKKVFNTDFDTWEITEIKRTRWVKWRKKWAKLISANSSKLSVWSFLVNLASTKWRDLNNEFKKVSDLVSVDWLSKVKTDKAVDLFISDIVSDEALLTEFKKFTSGIDMWVRTLVTISDWTEIANPKFLKNKFKRLKRLQKKVSKSENVQLKKRWLKKFSKKQRFHVTKNHTKKSRLVAKQYAKASDTRKDYQYKQTNLICRKLINEWKEVLFIEDLNVRWMMANHKLAKAIQDASIGQFISILKEIANKYWLKVISIWRFDASSKLCPDCLTINSMLTLADESWMCPNTDCNVYHDNRDLVAAWNMSRFGIKYVLRTYFEALLPVRAKPIKKEELSSIISINNLQVPQVMRELLAV